LGEPGKKSDLAFTSLGRRKDKEDWSAEMIAMPVRLGKASVKEARAGT